MEKVGRKKAELSNGKGPKALLMLSALLIAVGMTGSFSALGGFPILGLPFFACAAALFAYFSLKSLFPKKDYGSFACLAAAFGIFALNSSGVVRGVYMWLDGFLSSWNASFGTYFEGFGAREASRGDITAFCLVAAFLLTLVVCLLSEEGKTAALTAVCMAFLAAAIILAAAMPMWIGASLFGGWLMFWMGVFSDFEKRVFALAVPLALVMAVFLVLEPWGESRGRTGARFRESVRAAAERLRYGSDTLPEGDLRRAVNMNGGDGRVMLRVEMSYPETLYLRGFVGSELEGSRWRAPSSSAYRGDYRGMLDWLEEQGFSPAFQYGYYKKADGLSEDDRAPVSVTVSGEKAKRRYIYLPETADSMTGDGYAERDLSVRSSGIFGEGSYSFTYYTSPPTEVEAPSQWVNGGGTSEQRDFSRAEQVYRAFVYDNYLGISDGDRALAQRAFFSGDAWEGSDSLYTVTSRIRAVLRILADNTDDPPSLPSGQDFLPWFLGRAGEGNSSYFASAAVMAYRAVGVPARYAEGYLITEAQARQGVGRDIEVTADNAHAWVEIYVDGIGWRRVEVTPGFYAETHHSDVMIAVPNEAMEGSNGQLAAVPSSEDYRIVEPDLPEKEQRDGFTWYYIPLALLCLALCAEIYRLARVLLRMAAYRSMSDEKRLFANYDDIVTYMSCIVEGFDPQQPRAALAQAADIPGFDMGLYLRTVGRVERCVYGNRPPSRREVESAEALSRSLRELAASRLPTVKRFFRRYTPSATGEK